MAIKWNMPSEPETALIKCKTSKGDVWMELYRDWSPNGYDRAVSLYEKRFYDNVHFYRVVPGYLIQFGISYTEDEALKELAEIPIMDDPPIVPPVPFERGVISFAGDSEDSRTSQLFISYGMVDDIGTETWETPIGRVIKGMSGLESFLSYGDIPPFGSGPDQARIRSEGKAYVNENFPHLEHIDTCTVERRGGDIPVQSDVEAIALPADNHSQFQALGDIFSATNVTPDWENTHSVGVVAIMIFLCYYFMMKVFTDEASKEISSSEQIIANEAIEKSIHKMKKKKKSNKKKKLE